MLEPFKLFLTLGFKPTEFFLDEMKEHNETIDKNIKFLTDKKEMEKLAVLEKEKEFVKKIYEAINITPAKII
jgi:hypothetical protein